MNKIPTVNKNAENPNRSQLNEPVRVCPLGSMSNALGSRESITPSIAATTPMTRDIRPKTRAEMLTTFQ